MVTSVWEPHPLLCSQRPKAGCEVVGPEMTGVEGTVNELVLKGEPHRSFAAPSSHPV